MRAHTPNKRRQKPITDSQPGRDRRLHRIQEVRMREGVALRTIAERTKTAIRELESQENESSDIPLSVLYKWQRELRVPASELLAESNGLLSEPIRQRACMIRLAKTALTLLEKAESETTRRLAKTVVELCIEIMPELRDVTSWPERGSPRRSGELGRIAECPMPDTLLFHEHLPDDT